MKNPRTRATTGLIAASFATLAACAAHAESNVTTRVGKLTIYGLVDVGATQQSDGVGANLDKSVSKIDSGIANSSRVGFKLTRKLGELDAGFVAEAGYQADDGNLSSNNKIFNRQTFLELGGKYGSLRGGRQYTPHYDAMARIDPFGRGLAGNSNNVMTFLGNDTSRQDNSAQYISPSLSGVGIAVMYGSGETVGDSSKGSYGGGALTYANGPIYAALSYESREDTASSLDASNTMIAGAYDFGIARVSAAYAETRDFEFRGRSGVAAFRAGYKSNDLLLGVSVPLGPGTLLASYLHRDDETRSARDVTQSAIGYLYPIDADLTIYASYGVIDNDNNAGFTVGDASNRGIGERNVNAGLTLKF